jgi:hypothetical protein
MSAIDLSTIRPANADLLSFAEIVISLDEQGILGATIAEMERQEAADKARKAKPTRVPSRKAAPAKTAAPTVKNDDWRSRPMSAKQNARIVKVSNEHGFDVYDMTGWSAGKASDYYKSLVAAI